MRQRAKFLVLGIGVSASVALVFMCALANIIPISSTLPGAFLAQLPSILTIGAAIGWVAYRLKARRLLVVVGASYGWLAGLFISNCLLFVMSMQIDQAPRLLFFIAIEIIVGSVSGSLPTLIGRALKRDT